jgi:hypothetical protein
MLDAHSFNAAIPLPRTHTVEMRSIQCYDTACLYQKKVMNNVSVRQ